MPLRASTQHAATEVAMTPPRPTVPREPSYSTREFLSAMSDARRTGREVTKIQQGAIWWRFVTYWSRQPIANVSNQCNLGHRPRPRICKCASHILTEVQTTGDCKGQQLATCEIHAYFPDKLPSLAKADTCTI